MIQPFDYSKNYYYPISLHHPFLPLLYGRLICLQIIPLWGRHMLVARIEERHKTDN